MKYKFKFAGNLKYILGVLVFTSLFSCSKNDDNFNGGTAKISGRVSDGNGLKGAYIANGQSNESSVGVEGAAVTVAEVQADGSLKTVSTQSVQTDASGKFTVETNTSGATNLVVVATKGASEWKAVVSSEVKSGATVYAQTLNTESTAEAEVYARLKATGKTNVVSQADVQFYVNADVAAQIKGNVNAQNQFISSLEARAQAKAKAASNSYFNITSSQMQAIASASAKAQASYETALYQAGESESTAQAEFENYQKAIVSAYTNANVSVEAYAKLSAISSSAFVQTASGMSAQAYLASAESNYLRVAFILRQAVEAQFKTAGAASAQSSAVASAGVNLTNSIQSAVSVNQIIDAFAQYHSAVVAQLKLTVGAQASAIDTMDANINGNSGIKATLKLGLGLSVSTDAVVNAYVTYFNAIKTMVQTSMSGASSAQMNASSELLILTNLNL